MHSSEYPSHQGGPSVADVVADGAAEATGLREGAGVAGGGERRSDAGRVVPHRRSKRFMDFFGWYTGRLFRKRFAAVRFERESLACLSGLDGHDGPVIMLGNHPSWWDPLVAVLLSATQTPARPMMAVMDADELERFGFFRRLGVMGVDPDDPSSLEPMVSYLEGEFARERRSTLWITPQGHFTDVRAPLRLRPGAARLAARLPGVRVGALAMEFCFWDEQLPQLCIRYVEVATPERETTTGWLRSMSEAMRSNQEALAALVIARRADPFTVIGGKGVAGHNPVYDLWLRLRGRGGALGARRRAKADGAPG